MNPGNIDRFLARRRRANPYYSAREGMRMVSVSHGNIRVRVTGTGPQTVVFVCDMPVVIEHYDRLFTLIEPRYRVVCMELPGMGFSVPGPTFAFTLGEQAGVVEQVLRTLGVQACTVAFSCVNGYLALLLAQNAPELVRRVVVLQTPSWEEEKRWARRIDFRGKGWVATPVLGQLIVALSQRVIARRWFAKALSGSSDAAELSARAAAAFDAGCGWALASLTQAYFSAAAPVFAPISQPGLVIWGTQDRTHRMTDTRSVLQYRHHRDPRATRAVGRTRARHRRAPRHHQWQVPASAHRVGAAPLSLRRITHACSCCGRRSLRSSSPQKRSTLGSGCAGSRLFVLGTPLAKAL